jgi:Acyl-CoA dehydrogenase, C-terminal domain
VPATVLAEVIREIAPVDPAIAQIPQGHVPVDPGLVIPYQGAFEAPQQFGARAQLVHAVAAEVASDMFSLSGASAADERYDLSRHWRNARTHASHDPVAWKYHHIGNYLLNDVLPPNHGQI